MPVASTKLTGELKAKADKFGSCDFGDGPYDKRGPIVGTASGDGQCGAWARLFWARLAIHGIESKVTKIDPIRPSGIQTVVMLVKKWDMTKTPPKDETGVAGQGNDDPKSTFLDHGVVRYNGVIYDASYGTKHEAKDSESAEIRWENDNIDGFRQITTG